MIGSPAYRFKRISYHSLPLPHASASLVFLSLSKPSLLLPSALAVRSAILTLYLISIFLFTVYSSSYSFVNIFTAYLLHWNGRPVRSVSFTAVSPPSTTVPSVRVSAQ